MSHGDTCKKYPVLGARVDAFDLELAAMIRRGLQKLGKSIPQSPQECKTRKLSDEEIRQRREYVATVREARRKKQAPPRPPWEKFDPELERIIREGRAAQARTTPPVFEEME
ncbi:hypothetical protein [Streptomyces californicus]|uniref:hypothetical protein n=1 Tax=Streptomyces californicus TaxID=67351 RepID=UPI0033CB33D5